jgi:hypothetical protein
VSYEQLFLYQLADQCAIGPTSIVPNGTDVDAEKLCQCGTTFAELSASAIKKTRAEDDDSRDRESPLSPGTPGKDWEAAADAARNGGGASGSA